MPGTRPLPAVCATAGPPACAANAANMAARTDFRRIDTRIPPTTSVPRRPVTYLRAVCRRPTLQEGDPRPLQSHGRENACSIGARVHPYAPRVAEGFFGRSVAVNNHLLVPR